MGSQRPTAQPVDNRMRWFMLEGGGSSSPYSHTWNGTVTSSIICERTVKHIPSISLLKKANRNTHQQAWTEETLVKF